MKVDSQRMQDLVSLCKRRGIVFPSSEIYGGINGCWDYGPLGTSIKKNIKDHWWHTMVQKRNDIVGIDCSILMNSQVWKASGHLDSFSDPMMDCLSCHGRFRADHIQQLTCPQCQAIDRWTPVRQFNLMFETSVGASEQTANQAYLRPETCQGIFVQFSQVVQTSRMSIPFGIAQIGKAFRNEINPRNFTFRSREFEQMELEYFCHPKDATEWFDYWKNERYRWYLELGIESDRLHQRIHAQDELAHYALGCVDIEYDFPFGRAELEGIANRADHDLKAHQQHSGKDLRYFDAQSREHYHPYVIEPSAGADRVMLALLTDAYRQEENRVVLGLHPAIAPIQLAIFPLVNKDGMPEMAELICQQLRPHLQVYYDDKGAIGRRYRRQDEIGTPFCCTVDGQSTSDSTVTLRHRDSMKQERLAVTELHTYLKQQLSTH